MNWADYILLAAVAVCFISALTYTIRLGKKGGCMGCGSGGSGNGSRPSGGRSGCSGCGMKNGCSECSSYGAEKRGQATTP